MITSSARQIVSLKNLTNCLEKYFEKLGLNGSRRIRVIQNLLTSK